MILPKQAPVRPRAIAPVTGAVLLLEEIVRDLVGTGRRGSIEIAGPPGSGKTTALNHLAKVLRGNGQMQFLDRPTAEQVQEPTGWVVYAWDASAPEVRPTAVLQLAPWGADDRIEYLLSVHKGQCTSVMNRLQSSAEPPVALAGNAELWCIVLDAMAADASLTSARQALQRHLTTFLQDEKTKTVAAACSLAALLHASCPAELHAKLRQQPAGDAAAHALRHRVLQILVAAEQVVQDLQTRSGCDYFRRRFPRDLVEEVGKAANQERRARAKLEAWFIKPELQSTAASILHAAGFGWMPGAGATSTLAGAHLSKVQWPGVDLRQVNLTDVDLSDADLHEANLDHSQAAKANLGGADLRGASLVGIAAPGADFRQADLAGAHAAQAVVDGSNLEDANLAGADLRHASFAAVNLRGASLCGARLRQAKLVDVQLMGADFSGADLHAADLAGVNLNEANFAGASFCSAQLAGCNLEGMELTAPEFTEANLENALLTGSAMPDARLDDACLAGAGLAEIDWPRASLRGADLSGASFHLGSSRSGLVGSPIACEGSRTGFYTDDYTEQDFKSPEEIRKANLRGADLRGALIGNADFYLVDLREARFDPDQEAHLRRCGAILENRGRCS